MNDFWRDIENDVARADIAEKLEELAALKREQRTQPGMAARLGNVLWWVSCVVCGGVALAVLTAGAYGQLFMGGKPLPPQDLLGLLVTAAICGGPPLLIGRALKYILAGK
jgi:hypothetical protein